MATIIFDFDGTIADSFGYVVDYLAAAAKLPALSHQEQESLRGLSMAAIGRRFGLSWPRLLWLFFSGRRRMGPSMRHLKPFAGMPELIHKLHAEGHELFLVSSNTVRNIRAFLHHHGLHTYFLEIYGGIGLFSKAPALRKLLAENKLERDTAIYIGDESRDIEAAQAIGLRVIAVSWGFSRERDLASHHPVALVHNPAELLSSLEEV